MEEIVYLSVRIGCAGYLLYKLWNQKKRVRKICGLLYTPGKKEKEEEGTSCGTGPGDVMGATRFVYLDENAGMFAAPYMSQRWKPGTIISEKKRRCRRMRWSAGFPWKR